MRLFIWIRALFIQQRQRRAIARYHADQRRQGWRIIARDNTSRHRQA